ncbi:MAG: biotin--[acetyl-CoA-carboxylase] ligase [Holosporales bacterium]|jgi:BirA family biotin operon repressor/biotin-[acetyl-CoA-carboxylase] ligase|nr:biotin--[acetyl-CoA-carboxylase] ligase [Holosporales bacterium]
MIRLLNLKEVDSTNNYCKSLIYSNPHIEDTIVISRVQTAGRGRLYKRVWVSVVGNFHGSYIINIGKFGIKEEATTILASRLLIAVHKFLGNLTQSDQLLIKLPNDILVKDKKLSGILVEIIYPFAVIGIGINLTVSAVKTSTNLKKEFKILIKPVEIARDLYEALIKEII